MLLHFLVGLLLYKYIELLITLLSPFIENILEPSPSPSPPPPQNKIGIVSCLVYLTNAASACDTIYSNSFLFLTATSIIYRVYYNKITTYIDRIAIINIMAQGGRIIWIYRTDEHTDKVYFIIISCLLVMYTHINNTLNLQKYGEFELNLRHAILIHLLSSIGHHGVISLQRDCQVGFASDLNAVSILQPK